MSTEEKNDATSHPESIVIQRGGWMMFTDVQMPLSNRLSQAWERTLHSTAREFALNLHKKLPSCETKPFT